MAPTPDAGQLEPGEAVQVQVTDVRLGGGVSATMALVAIEGPAFVTTIWYAIGCPGVTVDSPSVLVTARSACGVTAPLAARAQKPECSTNVPPIVGPPASGWPMVPERP